MEVVEGMLVDSVSLDESKRSHAFDTMQRIEKDPNFLLYLLSLFQSACDSQLRFLAICCFRNTVKRLYSSLNAETKQRIKSWLIELVAIVVEHSQLVAQIIRQIARIEFPSHWPELAQFLVDSSNRISSMNSEKLDSFSLILYSVVKELESKRLLVDRKESANFAEFFLPVILPQWEIVVSQSPRRLDGAVLRLCRFRLHSSTNNIVQRILVKLTGNSLSTEDEDKLWKEISNLYEHQPSAFDRDQITRLASEAICRNKGREYVLHILRVSKFKPDKHLFETIVSKFLLLSEADVVEWMSCPDESLGGPLDGDHRRQEGEMFFLNHDVRTLAMAAIESAFSNGRIDLADAWLVVLSHQELPDARELMEFTGKVFNAVSTNSSMHILIQFRLIQLVKSQARKLTIDQLREAVTSLTHLLQTNRNSCIAIAIFFALKSMFDRSFDDQIWLTVGPVMSSTGMMLLSQVRAADTLWRILNAMTLLSTTSVSNSTTGLLMHLFQSKDLLIKLAIFDFLKSQLVAADDVGEGVSSELASCCLEIVSVSFSIVGSSSDQETVESLVSGASSLLTAVLRTSTTAPDLSRQLVERLCSSFFFSRETMECLIEINIAGTVTSAEVCKLQLDLCSRIINEASQISENILDETLVLLEVLGKFNLDYIDYLLLDEDDCPVPYDSLLQLFVSLSDQIPIILKGHSRVLELASALWSRVLTCRLPRTKIRQLSGLVYLVPVIAEVSLSRNDALTLLQRVAQVIPIVESEYDGEVMRLSSRLVRSNRFDGMPRPVRREAFLNAKRSVDTAELKARIDQYTRVLVDS